MNTPITNLNGGEASPKLHERVDVEKYPSLCKILSNFIPSIYGGVERRPGTQYLATANADTSRLIPFIYSASIAYFIEITDKAMRFFYDGDLIAGADIVTPYAVADIFSLHVKQIADVMRITHPNYAPMKLSRTAATTFTLEAVDFRKGPFLVRNDLTDPVNPSTTTLQCSVTTVGAYGTLKASLGVFQDKHAGALFKLVHKRTVTQISISGNDAGDDELDIKGSAYYVSAGTWAGKVILQRQDNNSDWTDFRTYEGLTSGARNDSLGFTEKEDNIKYRMVSTGMSGNFSATLNVFNPDREGIVRILSVVDSKNAVVEVLQELELTTATTRWYEGSWSNVRGWPATLTFSGDRCIYAGALSGSGATSDQLIEDYPSLMNLSL